MSSRCEVRSPWGVTCQCRRTVHPRPCTQEQAQEEGFMRTLSGFITAVALTAGLLAITSIRPDPALAQCSMGGGGHDHGAGQPVDKKGHASEKKQRQSVAKLLSDDQGRMVLANALLEDRDFMWAFIPRIVATPEWRDLFSLRISQVGTAPVTPGATLKGDTAVIYACPMHPDVTSSKPGSCPRCGMALEPRDTRGGSR